MDRVPQTLSGSADSPLIRINLETVFTYISEIWLIFLPRSSLTHCRLLLRAIRYDMIKLSNSHIPCFLIVDLTERLPSFIGVRIDVSSEPSMA